MSEQSKSIGPQTQKPVGFQQSPHSSTTNKYISLLLSESSVKMIQTGTLTADITLPLGEDRDTESAAGGNRFDNPFCVCVCVCVEEEMNPQTEDDDPSLSHSAAASCLRKIDENLPSGLKAFCQDGAARLLDK